VDVVVPFKGSAAELEEVRAALARLRLESSDSVLVVDNSLAGRSLEGAVPVLHAAEVQAPGFARNRGSAVGSAEWLVFFDADVVPPEDLLDRYFDPAPDEHTGLIAGGVADEEVPADGPAAARYAYLRRSMSQDHTFSFGRWAFAQTANAAVRRTAFAAVGGFREDIRAAEDADLNYRLRAAGWDVERRENAAVVHRSRQTVRSFLTQKAVHGAGAAWLFETYPGSFPGHRRPGLLWWAARHSAGGLVAAARRRSRDDALWALFEPLDIVAREFGRSLSNSRPRLR
jgi:mycofactocin glycosyltransferase